MLNQSIKATKGVAKYPFKSKKEATADALISKVVLANNDICKSKGGGVGEAPKQAKCLLFFSYKTFKSFLPYIKKYKRLGHKATSKQKKKSQMA